MNIFSVSALTITGRTIDKGTNIRKGASTSFGVLGSTEYGMEFSILEAIPTSNVGACSSDWYKFDYKGQMGYICGDFVAVYKKREDTDVISDYARELETAGFPASYIPYLEALHEKHPNWTFEPLLTGINFSDAVKAESALGVSLLQDGYAFDGWKTTVSPAYDYGTDKWKSYDSGNWVAANSEVIAYFMDPRNFLNDSRIFQFEKLNFDESYQTVEAVQAIFGANTLFYDHASTFVEAGREYNVNSVYLAAKVRQEVGVNGSGSTSGGAFTYNGILYEGGFYNVYNIGAYRTSAGDAIARGLYWAMGGFGINNPDKYLRPWNTLDLSIKGGAYWIADGYINSNQHTVYLQRFNVAKGYVGTSHQYQTDLRAPYYTSASSYISYYKNGLSENSFKFVIPVYEEMPEATYLPSSGNPNHHLKELKVNDTLVTGFTHDVNEYTFYVRSGATSVDISATPINKNATIAGTGAILLTGDTTISNIEVTAANGDKNIYKINIVKSGTIEMTPNDIVDASSLKRNGRYISGVTLGTSIENFNSIIKKTSVGASVVVKTSGGVEKTTGLLGTGDVITINNGTASNDYSLVLYGDASGDGEISILDLIKVQKHILGYEVLNAGYNSASDINFDGEINVIDLIMVQKHILGFSQINQ